MSDEVQPIFELSKKFRGLMDWAIQWSNHAANSERSISESSGVKRSTLKTNINTGKMSLPNQEAIAKVFGFAVGWPEWRDPDVTRTTAADQRRDTAKAFLERFLTHKSKPARSTIEVGLTNKHVDRRFADFSFAVPGSFEPSSQAEGIPLVLSLSFDRRGWPILLAGTTDVLTVGLKGVDLQLFHTGKSARIDASDIICHSDVEGNFRGKVEGLSPWWVIGTVIGDASWLMGRRLRNDGQDCVARGFHVGDQIRAVMTARVNDCFVRVAGEPFEGTSEAKVRFIEHLSKLSVLNGTEAVLGEQLLTVVEKL